MEKIRICSIVVGSNLTQFLNNLEEVQEISNMVELRTDKLTNLSEENLLIIKKQTKIPAILTCRDKKTLLTAIKLKFNFVDIDLDTVEKNNLIFPINRKTKVIISFHDFKKTPSIEVFNKIIINMKKHKPDIIKIATYVRNDEDVINLTRLMIDGMIDFKRIIIGMGKKGKVTRIFGPMLGNFLTYASTNRGVSAPGQINVNDMKKIYKLMN